MGRSSELPGSYTQRAALATTVTLDPRTGWAVGSNRNGAILDAGGGHVATFTIKIVPGPLVERLTEQTGFHRRRLHHADEVIH
jgi:hypothetical protein